MPYQGEYNLGQSVPLLVRTVNAAGTPVEPNDVPGLIVYLGATEVFRGEVPVIERRSQTGTFFISLFLGPEFSEGNHVAVFSWVLPDTYIGSAEATFRIVPGGNSDGAVVSSYFYDRPSTDFLVHQLERGVIVPGKSPRI